RPCPAGTHRAASGRRRARQRLGDLRRRAAARAAGLSAAGLERGRDAPCGGGPGPRPTMAGGMSERQRLDDAAARRVYWKRWGPYVSAREWGTVREDYSPHGTAWEYFPHDHARSRAYRWGEDGIAGICDNHQRLCFALALWNGRDPILKERLFGLSGDQGNHGE